MRKPLNQINTDLATSACDGKQDLMYEYAMCVFKRIGQASKAACMQQRLSQDPPAASAALKAATPDVIFSVRAAEAAAALVGAAAAAARCSAADCRRCPLKPRARNGHCTHSPARPTARHKLQHTPAAPLLHTACAACAPAGQQLLGSCRRSAAVAHARTDHVGEARTQVAAAAADTEGNQLRLRPKPSHAWRGQARARHPAR
jgi:hypothetical protein